MEEDFVDPEKDEGKQGAAIGFNYNQENQQLQENSALAPTVFVQEEPEPPSLRTLANVLEKTAEFIAKNGAQMEILMRAKEAGNLKFQFLNPDNPYHPIYKQVLDVRIPAFSYFVPPTIVLNSYVVPLEVLHLRLRRFEVWALG